MLKGMCLRSRCIWPVGKKVHSKKPLATISVFAPLLDRPRKQSVDRNAGKYSEFKTAWQKYISAAAAEKKCSPLVIYGDAAQLVYWGTQRFKGFWRDRAA